MKKTLTGMTGLALSALLLAGCGSSSPAPSDGGGAANQPSLQDIAACSEAQYAWGRTSLGSEVSALMPVLRWCIDNGILTNEQISVRGGYHPDSAYANRYRAEHGG